MNTTPNNGTKSHESLKVVQTPGVTGCLNPCLNANLNNLKMQGSLSKNDILMKKVNSQINITKEKELLNRDREPSEKNETIVSTNGSSLNSLSNKLRIVKGDFIPTSNPNIHNKLDKSKSIVPKKTQKIETIIDGNNDSFINELADLLNNVDSPVKNKNEDSDNNNIKPEAMNNDNMNVINLDDEIFDEKAKRLFFDKNEANQILELNNEVIA